MIKKVTYRSNNSGGSWWLTDKNWKALEEAGWKVDWIKDSDKEFYSGRDRWLGALAMSAERIGLSMQDAVAEWEKITRLNSTDAGCACCGQPHNFSYYEDDKYVDGGPHTSYEASW